jgi:hypothetical protein
MMHAPGYLLLQFFVCALYILGHIVQHPPSAVQILSGQGALVVQGLPGSNVFLRVGTSIGVRYSKRRKNKDWRGEGGERCLQQQRRNVYRHKYLFLGAL